LAGKKQNTAQKAQAFCVEFCFFPAKIEIFREIPSKNEIFRDNSSKEHVIGFGPVFSGSIEESIVMGTHSYGGVLLCYLITSLFWGSMRNSLNKHSMSLLSLKNSKLCVPNLWPFLKVRNRAAH